MLISDWSSDGCSSYLIENNPSPQLVQVFSRLRSVSLNKFDDIHVTCRVVTCRIFAIARHGHRRSKMNAFPLLPIKTFGKKCMVVAGYLFYFRGSHPYPGPNSQLIR